MPRTKVTKTEYEGSDGRQRTQYRTTIPKNIAEMLEMEGAELDWSSGSAARKVELEVIDIDEEEDE